MWLLLWICAFLLLSSTAAAAAQQEQDINNRNHRHEIRYNKTSHELHTIRQGHFLGGGSVTRIPPCAATCQKKYYINTTTECTHRDVFTSDITRCVQQTCPHLQDVLDWQTYYAFHVCNIEARDDGPPSFLVCWTLFGVASICVFARLLARSRWLEGPGFWWDDFLVIVLWVLEIEQAVCLTFVKENCGGRDAIGVDASHVQGLLKWVFINVPFYIIGTYGSKVVWVLLYIRMWDFNTTFRKICWISIGISLVVIVSFIVGAIVLYWPIHYYMDNDSPIVREYQLGINVSDAVIALAGITIAMDFWVLLLPIPKLMSLTGVSRQKKMGICGVFLLGFICTACSIVRLYYIIPLKNTTNATWDFGHFGTWCEIEVHLSMTSCNLPVLAGLIKRLKTKYRESRNLDSDESAGMTDSRGLSNRLPPKHTPKLNTWKGGSISMSTEEGGQQSEDGYGERMVHQSEEIPPH